MELFRIDYKSTTNRVAYVRGKDTEDAKERFQNGEATTDYEDNGVDIDIVDVYEG